MTGAGDFLNSAELSKTEEFGPETASALARVAELASSLGLDARRSREISIGIGKVVLPDDHPLAWQNDALCAEVDPELFFPEKGGSNRDGKKICNVCEVKEECLQYALQNDQEHGIWGGTSKNERKRMMGHR